MIVFFLLLQCADAAKLLDLPATIRIVIINLGTNISPIMPPIDDESVAVIGVEANYHLADRMPQHKRLFMIYCAVSDDIGIRHFEVYNRLGMSSSLSKASFVDFTSTSEHHKVVYAPVIPLSTIIDSIPANVAISLLKTDLQGHDYVALRSAGESLRRVKRLMVECYGANYATYDGVVNECERDIIPLVESFGFKLDKMAAGYRQEYDAYFDNTLVHHQFDNRLKVLSEWRRLLDFVPLNQRMRLMAAVSPLLSSTARQFQPAANNIYDAHLASREFKSLYVPRAFAPVSTDNIVYSSQCGQDYIVMQLLHFTKSAQPFYYVDLAANDAKYISNTYALDRHLGWSGLCIEANPRYWYGLTQQRNCDVYGLAVAAPNVTSVKFNFRNDAGYSGGIAGFDNKEDAGEIIPAMDLMSVFKNSNTPSVIDYFSLDVEGAELFIMEHFPFHEYRFNILTVERPGEKLSELLRRNNYVYVDRTANFDDELWLHKEFETQYHDATQKQRISVQQLLLGFTGSRCKL